MHPGRHRKLWNQFLSTLAALAMLLGCHSIATCQQDSNHNLNIIIPGINDQASAEWFGNAAMLAPTRERYWIVYDDGQRAMDQRRPYGQLLTPTPLVPPGHIVRINPQDPQSMKRLQELALRPSATFVVDMDLSMLSPGPISGPRSWNPQTQWAGEVAALLAQTHRTAYPDGRVNLFGHSAGTEAVTVALNLESRRAHHLFDQPIVASVRNPEALLATRRRDTIVMTADGDFIASPHGVPFGDPRGEPAALAQNGFRVLHIANTGQNASFRQAIASRISRHARAYEAHTQEVNRLWVPDRRILVYPSDGRNPIPIASAALGNVIQAMTSPTGTGGQPTRMDAQRINQIVNQLRHSEPTQGLGGISLSAVARMPIDAKDVEEAGFRDGRLYLRLRAGKTILLPNLDREVVLLSYQVAYRDDSKPELSIGSPPQGTQERPQEPGWIPVYYLGNTENTALGLAMARADKLLGDLAYGPTAKVRSIREKVPDFHSVAELFPQKYTDHEDAHRYVGLDERVYLQCSQVQMDWSEKAAELRFSDTSFSVRFGKAGPAEEAFAAFFTTHFDEIADTQLGAPLKALVPYANAVACFRWLKSQGVSFVPGELAIARHTLVFTPNKVEYIPLPRFSEIVPARPTITFGPLGPERIMRADGHATVVTYENGKPSKVSRYDGMVLEVIRGSAAVPIGLRMSSGHEAAFFIHEKLGPVFAENIRLNQEAGKLTVQTQDDSVFYPDHEPEAMIALVLSRFAFAEPVNSSHTNKGYPAWAIALGCVILIVIIALASKRVFSLRGS